MTTSDSAETPRERQIGYLIFEDADLLDVTGPLEFLGSRFPKAGHHLIAQRAAPITLEPRLRVLPDVVFERVRGFGPDRPDDIHLDVLVVPGGRGLTPILVRDHPVLRFVKSQQRHVDFMIGICAGALLQAAAGVLDGLPATTHWASLPLLDMFGKVRVSPAPGDRQPTNTGGPPFPGYYPRYVVGRRDGVTYMTCSGVTSALDLSLELVALMSATDQDARNLQLLVQYSPVPPFDEGRPDTASSQTLTAMNELLAPVIDARREKIRALVGND